MEKYFFGWTNIKKLMMELMKIYSNQDSYFSKKRIESGIAFIIAQTGMILYFKAKYMGMDMYDMLMWAGAEFSICGYIINGIQKEKLLKTDVPEVLDAPEPDAKPVMDESNIKA